MSTDIDEISAELSQKLAMRQKLNQKLSNGTTASSSSGFSGDSSISSDDETAQSKNSSCLGYDIMKVDLNDIPICPLKVKEITHYLENHGSTGPHVERYLRTALNAWQMKGANVAVIGESGVGKSMLVSYLTGKWDGKDSENIPLPKKSCKKPKAYEHKINPNLQFWEIPIGGSDKYGNKKIY
jgi:ABC-type glutathione transport system ATPase component